MFETYPEVVSIQNASEMLNISTFKVYQLVNKGEIPSRRIGRKYRLTKDSIIRFITESPEGGNN